MLTKFYVSMKLKMKTYKKNSTNFLFFESSETYAKENATNLKQENIFCCDFDEKEFPYVSAHSRNKNF